MTEEKRGSFGSKIGIILATAGSAVGLGNVWRFPYMTGENGGAAFILVYIVFIFLLGIPGMVNEFIIGRHSASNAARAYHKMSRGRPWRGVGQLGILCSTIILGFYSVVAGWCLQYLYASIAGQLSGDADYVRSYFQEFSSSLLRPILWSVGFVLLTHLVIIRGVKKGIERISKLLMPTLFVLLIILVIASCMLPGAMAGVEFLFKPDFSKITSDVILAALGQSFFSLSLGTACLCTYASYFGRETNLLKSAVQISIIDTIIAILAGLMIFPAAFSVGVSPDSGPSLVFITLPNVFQQAFASMPIVGYVISILFYALLAVAALTSTISMHEIGTAYFHEELKRPRVQAAWIVTVGACVIGMLSSMSCGACNLRLLGMSLMDFFDCITAQYMMPIGALLTSLYIGWGARTAVVNREFTNCGTVYRRLFPVYLFMVRFICPILIAIVFLNQLGVI
ncbi:MAG: sodium-dependent transporter [Prevotellaceae bacterium]|nr:sodium-dependent transporter [Prevotellaceae bacterium]